MAHEDKFQINTGEIYEHEYLNWQTGDKHRALIEDMELKILRLLRDNGLCGRSQETGHAEEYEKKEKEFEQNLANLSDERFPPFTYFFVSKTIAEDGSIKWMICDYHASYIIRREDSKPDIFEFFFAFKLRQVNLMLIDSFLNYHMMKNFGNDKRSCFRFLTLLMRKYQVLYDEARIKTIDEWMDKGYWSTDDQISALKDEDKIKWNGYQNNLAELFIELQNKGWIDEIEPEKIQRAFTNTRSIAQILKLSKDPDSKKLVFDQVYKDSYRPKFGDIRFPKNRKTS